MYVVNRCLCDVCVCVIIREDLTLIEGWCFLTQRLQSVCIAVVDGSEISVTETITEMEIIDPTLTETETMVFVETEII